MPFVKLLRPSLVGARVHDAGAVLDMNPRLSEAFVRSGAGAIVPPGTPSDAPEHETSAAEAAPEKAAKRAR